MRFPARFAACCAFLLAALPPARANDSAAEQAAGGLVLVESGTVAMSREDLRIGVERIDVAYEFRNAGKRDETLTVAFPLPSLDGADLAMTPLTLPFPDERNFVHFTVAVDGKTVEPVLEERAYLGKDDVTSVLERYKLNLNPLHQGVYEAIEGLPTDTRNAVVKAGLAIEEEWAPQWRYEARFHFPVTFPAGRIVKVKHSYAPVRGSFLVTTLGLKQDAEMATRFCIDSSTKKGLTRVVGEAAKVQSAADPASPPVEPDNAAAAAVVIPYILTTANNWAGPIGAFNLTIDKGAPENILSLCQEGIRKTGPTTFTFSAKNYAPKRDLLVMIAAPTYDKLGVQ